MTVCDVTQQIVGIDRTTYGSHPTQRMTLDAGAAAPYDHAGDDMADYLVALNHPRMFTAKIREVTYTQATPGFPPYPHPPS